MAVHSHCGRDRHYASREELAFPRYFRAMYSGDSVESSLFFDAVVVLRATKPHLFDAADA